MKCKNCNGQIDESQLNKYATGNFCSIECARSWSTKYDNKQETKKAFCIECGKEIKINKRASTKNCRCDGCKNEKRKDKREERGKKYCKYCGNEIENWRKNQKFCCPSCSYDYKKQISFQKIEETNGVGCFHTTIKKYLIHKYGNKCWICGLTEWMGNPIPLVLDHINGKSSDNNLENLRLVCGNCDMQLPTYKSKNKNSERRKRKGVW